MFTSLASAGRSDAVILYECVPALYFIAHSTPNPFSHVLQPPSNRTQALMAFARTYPYLCRVAAARFLIFEYLAT